MEISFLLEKIFYQLLKHVPFPGVPIVFTTLVLDPHPMIFNLLFHKE